MDRMNFCACDSCGKDIRECDSSCPKFSYNAHAVVMLLKQVEEITRLKSKLESAKEALREIALGKITVTEYNGEKYVSSKMPKIAQEYLGKLEE